MSFSDFKEISINNPGTATTYGSDDLNEIMRIFNNKVVSNRQVRISNPWQFTDFLDIVAPGSIPPNPGANTKRIYVDPNDLHLKSKSTGGTIIDFDILSQGSQGEANTASNIGTAGQGFFKQKQGVNLEFRKLNVASNKLSVELDTGNNEIDIDVVEAALLLQNMGGILTVSRGGTGVGTHIANSLLRGNGTGTIQNIAPGTNGHILTMVSGEPKWSAAGASQDIKTAVFESGTQVGSAGRQLNFPNADDFNITEDGVNDRFDIALRRSECLVGSWTEAGFGRDKPNVGTTYTDLFNSTNDGVGTDVDGTGKNDFRLYVSWRKMGGLGTHSLRVISQTTSDVLAENTNLTNGKNVITGTIPTFFQDNVRSVKLQVKSTISTDDPEFYAAWLYFK